MNILIVAGARPNFMKIAPIIRVLRAQAEETPILNWKLVHTGQHYDYKMSEVFFKDLGIPAPDFYLNVGSGSHAVQTARIMTGFEELCLTEQPQLVVVVGDVNSTLACSIVAKKLQIKVAHVEAGLRSFDQAMPEEINRLVTDSIADYLFVTEESGITNLLNEGKAKEQVYFVGHVMIDNLLYELDRLTKIKHEGFPNYLLKKNSQKYVFLTLHRPSNVDDKDVFTGISEAINEISQSLPVIFPVHPRTEKLMAKFGTHFGHNVHMLPPLNYRESLYFWKDAELVLTDSGGLQEETTALGVSCLTLRNNTERPITVTLGTNRLCGNKKDKIITSFHEAIQNPPTGTIPPKWDGHAAERIVNIIKQSAA